MHLALTIVLGVVAMGLAFALVIMWGHWPLDDSEEIAERTRERDVEHARAEALAQELAEMRTDRAERAARIEEALGEVSKGIEALRVHAEERGSAPPQRASASASDASDYGAERERALAEVERLGLELDGLREHHAAMTQQLTEVEQRERDLRAANDQQQQDVFDLAERLYRAECALAEKNGESEGEPTAEASEDAGHAHGGERAPGAFEEGSSSADIADEASILGAVADTEGAPASTQDQTEASVTREAVLAALGALEADLSADHGASSRPSYPRGSLTVVLDDVDELTVVSDDRAPSALVGDGAHDSQDLPADGEAEAGEHPSHLPRARVPDNDADDEIASPRRPLSIPDEILKAPAR
ncbi:MAG: hypothetical protein RL385_1310 [Pseudomonadota bacterium]|jgi:hypothetical protein